MPGEIQLEQLTKNFGDVVAVNGIDLTMPPGEFFTMLGPSGCGKTTTLRMIAGFERPTSGKIVLDGVDVANMPPHRRNVNTVFQSYALFPHLDVQRNVEFGLKYKRVTKEESRARALSALELVQLGGYERRKPGQLSGGQQQRVALARALVLTPQVLLLDEPLGALDARLRKDLQVELKALQAELGITFVFVTHDQEEALTMSDRLAVMSGGQVEQVGSPRELYEEPRTVFVADFLGVSNLIAAEAGGPDGDGCSLKVGESTLTALRGDTAARGSVKAMVRPERIEVQPHGADGPNRLAGLVERTVYVGSGHEIHVRIVGGELLKATIANDGSPLDYEQGTAVSLHLPADALRVLTDDGVIEQNEAPAEDEEPAEHRPPPPAFPARS